MLPCNIAQQQLPYRCKKINKYEVNVGTSLEFWEDKGWIKKNNPYGWMHWYCDFYTGKRCKDDRRQIDRWVRTAGPKSRFRPNLKLARLLSLGRKAVIMLSVASMNRTGPKFTVALTPILSMRSLRKP